MSTSDHDSSLDEEIKPNASGSEKKIINRFFDSIPSSSDETSTGSIDYDEEYKKLQEVYNLLYEKEKKLRNLILSHYKNSGASC